jgi:hypothetical protein
MLVRLWRLRLLRETLDGGFKLGDDGGREFRAQGHAGRLFAGNMGDDEVERGAVLAALVQRVHGVDA